MKLVELKTKIIWYLRYAIEAGFKSEEKVIIAEFRGFRGKIIDLGCGIGNFSTLFPDVDYYGADIDKNAIVYAQKYFPGKFFVHDAKDIKFPNDFFDAVLAVALFHHLEDNNVNKVCAEIKRVVKKKGKVLIIEDKKPSFWQNPFLNLLYKIDTGGKFRTPTKYKELFSGFFKIKEIYPFTSGLWRYNAFVLEA